MPRVLVAGAGIVGASVSVELAKRGCKVVVLEPAPQAPMHATRWSWAWLNASKKRPEHYQRLNAASMEAWRQQYGSLVRQCGSILLDDPSPSSPDAGYPCHPLSAQQLALAEPHVAMSPSEYSSAHQYRQEMYVDPCDAVAHMLEEARQHGADVRLGEGLDRMLLATPSSGDDQGAAGRGERRQHCVTGAVSTAGKEYAADAIVLASGAATQALAAQAGVQVPLLRKPCSVAITTPLPPGTIQGMLYARDSFAVQMKDGSVMLGGTEQVGEAERDEAAARWMAVLQSLVPAARSARIASKHTTHLPWPADGWPVVGSCSPARLAAGAHASPSQGTCSAASGSSSSSSPHAAGAAAGCEGLYVCVTHSGMTLAPLLGRLLAEEVCADASMLASGSATPTLGVNEDWLGPYRPGRSFTQASTNVAYSLWQKQGRQ